MGVHGGMFGAVNGESTIRNWTVQEVSAVLPFITSNTAGGRGRRPGIKDWSGSFNRYGASPLVLPGGTFVFSGFTSGITEILDGSQGTIYTGPAIVDSVAVTWNWETGGIIEQVVSFSANGALTEDSGAVPDATDPDVPSTLDIQCVLFGEGSGSGATSGDDAASGSVDNLTTAVLTLTSDNQSYVNCSTGGWTYRKPGPIDWTLALTLQDDRLGGGQLALNEIEEFKLYTDDTDYWRLQWGIVRDFTGLTVDRETGAIISHTVNIDMCGVDNDGVRGQITLPGETTPWWPDSFLTP